MSYLCWSINEELEKLQQNRLLGATAGEWPSISPFPPNRFSSYPDMMVWLAEMSRNFVGGNWINWGAVISDIGKGVSRSEALLQPSGMVWVFCVLVTPDQI